MKPRFAKFHLIVLVTWAACLAGLAASGQTPPGQTKPAPDTPPNANAGPAPNSAPNNAPKTPETTLAVDPNKYVIGVEDVLFIKTFHEPDFTLPLVVRPDGKITLPLVGELQAADLTPTQLTASIKEQLSQFIKSPDITIFVTDVRSKRYYIDGEVKRPGWFPLVTPTRVLEALSNALGFLEFANQKDVRILRKNKILHFNYKAVSAGKHEEQNIYVENGDHIIVR